MVKYIDPDDIMFTTEEIIEFAADNTAGTTLDWDAINNVVEEMLKAGKIDFSSIDKLIADNESQGGFLVKASDFIYAVKKRLDIIKSRN